MSYAYLASPYSHPDPLKMEHRYEAACAAFAFLLDRRIWTYSPIIHCHEVAKRHDLPRDAVFWRDYNLAMLEGAHTFFVLCIDGWEESRGLQDELAFAQRNKIPVRYVTPSDASGGFTLSSRKV